MSDTPKYEIRTVDDFLKVPEDRLDACLREFRVMLTMARNGQDLLKAVTDSVTGTPGAVIYPLGVFRWIDDDAHTVEFAVESGDERVVIIDGILREEYR